ncbi:MAG: hypothetical protein IPG72_06320 [Ardenticatenales bacterium]|nr:hypothetical protein [Ardenticatenales bacterium]
MAYTDEFVPALSEGGDVQTKTLPLADEVETSLESGALASGALAPTTSGAPYIRREKLQVGGGFVQNVIVNGDVHQANRDIINVQPAHHTSGHGSSDSLRVVIIIHGIRTHAEWIPRLRSGLEDDGAEAIEAKYGFLSIVRFLTPFLRGDAVRVVEMRINEVSNRDPRPQIDIIAHSFGTYIIAKILQRNPSLRVHRIILCGSILPQRYGWPQEFVQTPRRIVNDCGWRDPWPIAATAVTWGFGPSGAFGLFQTTAVENRHHPLSHSQFFSDEFTAKYWRPFLTSGRIEPGPSDRPTTPWTWSVLTIVQLKYVVLLLVGWEIYKAFSP